jgi:hypothetical protein
MLKKASWFACLMILAISCLDEPDCFRLNNNFAGVVFKKMYDGEADTVALIGVQASGTDSIFNSYVLTTAVYLNLNYFTEQTSFAIESLNEGINQLVLGYDVRTQFVSEDCGARYVLSNLQILSADYDSIRLIDGTPGASREGANIEIYRCPITNIMELSFRQLQAETSVASALKINSLTNNNGTPIHVDTTLSTVYLPLNPSGNSELFTINFADQVTPKTFGFNYSRTPITFFEKCSAQQLFHDIGITSDNFDSLLVVTDSLQDPPVTNLIAYRCPQTNLMQVYFRKNGSPVRNDTIDVKTIKGENDVILYQNQKLTYVILPLDPDSNSSTFTFELQTSTRILTVNYTRTPQTLFPACDAANGGPQILFSDLVATSDFTQTTVVSTADSVRFPAVTNVQIIQ